MTQNKDIRTRVGYTVDQSSIAAVQAANQKVALSVGSVSIAANELSADLLALNPQLARLVTAEQAVAQATTANSASVRATTAALGREKVQVDNLTDSYENLERQKRTSQGIRDIGMQTIPEPSLGDFGVNDNGGRSVGQNITRFGRGLFNAPDVGGSTTIARASIAGGAIVDKLGLSIGQVGAAAGIAAPLAIGFAVAVDRVSEATQAGERRLEAALSAQQAYYNAVANLSTQSVQERLTELRREQEAQQQALNNARGALEQNFQELQSRIGGQVTFVGDALARVFDNQIGLGTLREAVEEAETQLNSTTDEITRLEQGLQGNAFAANDAAEAEERLREIREAATEAIMQAQMQYADAFVRGEQLTTEARLAEIASLERQKESYERLIASGRQSTDEIQALNDKIDGLDNQIAGLLDASSAYADALAVQETRQEAFNEAFEGMGDALEKVEAASKKVMDIQERIGENDAEHAADMERIDTESKVKEEDARKKADIKAEEDLRKHLQKVAEIEQHYAYEAEAAVGSRDALALYKAQQKRAEDLNKEQTAYDEQQKALQTQLDEQLETIKEANKKAADAEEDSYRKRQAKLQRALQDAQSERDYWDSVAKAFERQANIGEVNDKLAHLADMKRAQSVANINEVNAEYSHAAMMREAAAYGRVGVYNEVAGLFNDIRTLAASARGGLGGAAGGGPGGMSDTKSVERIVDRRVVKMVKAANK